jgi:hypothetical protein
VALLDVRDKRIEKMFVEPQKPGDPFEISDADTMLPYLDPDAKVPEPVAILTREGCSFCAEAKKMLSEAGYDFAEIPLPHTIRTRRSARSRTRRLSRRCSLAAG